MGCSIINAHAPVVDQELGVLFDHGTPHFRLLQRFFCWASLKAFE